MKNKSAQNGKNTRINNSKLWSTTGTPSWGVWTTGADFPRIGRRTAPAMDARFFSLFDDCWGDALFAFALSGTAAWYKK